MPGVKFKEPIALSYQVLCFDKYLIFLKYASPE